MPIPYLPDGVYQWLKWIALGAMPTLGAFCATMALIFPETIQWGVAAVVIPALGLCLAGLIGISGANYDKAQKEAAAQQNRRAEDKQE